MLLPSTPTIHSLAVFIRQFVVAFSKYHATKRVCNLWKL